MLKISKVRYCLLQLSTLLLLAVASVPALAGLGEDAVAEMLRRAEELKTYEVELAVVNYKPDTPTDDLSMVDTLADVVAVGTTKVQVLDQQQMMVISQKQAEQSAVVGIMVFQKEKLFVELHLVTPDRERIAVMSADRQQLPTSMPFVSGYALSGNGLSTNRDFAGTIQRIIADYDLRLQKDPGDNSYLVLVGQLTTAARMAVRNRAQLLLGDADNTNVLEALRTSNFVKLIVDRTTWLPMVIEIGTAVNRPVLQVKVTLFQENPALTDQTFIYVPPANVTVQDATDAFKKLAEAEIQADDDAALPKP